ncbi:MAG: cobyrinic acid a,c-diamide synthase [Propionibacterium sp.]|nr:cobyrinic acid a,c-diamide synthase [Propionibacterium sp.]
MIRRASLPGASELFRPTGAELPEQPAAPKPEVAEKKPPAKAAPAAKPEPEPVAEKPPVASGRVRHDHKITVYFSEEELLALEDANLELRRHHGIRVDRGRLVRTAVALALHDLDADGDDSALVQHLRE